MSEIGDYIKQLAKEEFKNEQMYSLPCKVLSIDKNDFTCEVEPLNGDAEISDVRIQCDLGLNNGVLIIPKDGSNVMVTFINKQTAFISVYSEIDSYKIKINNTIFEMTDGETVFNDGSNGGTCNVPILRTELNKVTARITALEGLIVAFASAQITVAGSVPVFAPLIPGWTGLTAGIPALPPTGLFNTNIEDTKIKH